MHVMAINDMHQPSYTYAAVYPLKGGPTTPLGRDRLVGSRSRSIGSTGSAVVDWSNPNPGTSDLDPSNPAPAAGLNGSSGFILAKQGICTCLACNNHVYCSSPFSVHPLTGVNGCVADKDCPSDYKCLKAVKHGGKNSCASKFGHFVLFYFILLPPMAHLTVPVYMWLSACTCKRRRTCFHAALTL